MTPEPTSQAGSQTARVIQVPAPTAGTTTTVTMEPGSELKFGFNPGDASMSRSGNNLVFESDGGSVVITDFFVVGEEGGKLPMLRMPEGDLVPTEVAFAETGLDLSTAAGPGAGSPLSGGTNYDDDPGNLLAGINRLGSLGTDYWGRNTEPDIEQIGMLELPTGDFTFTVGANLGDGLGTVLRAYEDGRPEQHRGGDADTLQASRIDIDFNPGAGTSVGDVTLSGLPAGTQIYLGDPASGGTLVSDAGGSLTFSAGDFTGQGVYLIPPHNSDDDFTFNLSVDFIRGGQSITVSEPVTVIVDAVADKPDVTAAEFGDVKYGGPMTVGEENKATQERIEDGWAKDDLHKTGDGVTVSGPSLSVPFSTTITFGDYQDNSESHYALVEVPKAGPDGGNWIPTVDSPSEVTVVRDDNGAAKIITLYFVNGVCVGDTAPTDGTADAKSFYQFEVPNVLLESGQGTLDLDLSFTSPKGENILEDTQFILKAGGMADEGAGSDNELRTDNNQSYTFSDDYDEVDTPNFIVDTIDSTLSVKVGWTSEDLNALKHQGGTGDERSKYKDADFKGMDDSGIVDGKQVADRGTLDGVDGKSYSTVGAPVIIAIDGSTADVTKDPVTGDPVNTESMTQVIITVPAVNGVPQGVLVDGGGKPLTPSGSDANGVTYTFGQNDFNTGNTALNDVYFKPNDKFSDDDVELGYKVTVTASPSGASAEFSGNTVAVIDAVADKPGTAEIDYSVDSGANYVAPGQTATVTGKAQFADNDGSETHYLVVTLQEGYQTTGWGFKGLGGNDNLLSKNEISDHWLSKMVTDAEGKPVYKNMDALKDAAEGGDTGAQTLYNQIMSMLTPGGVQGPNGAQQYLLIEAYPKYDADGKLEGYGVRFLISDPNSPEGVKDVTDLVDPNHSSKFENGELTYEVQVSAPGAGTGDSSATLYTRGVTVETDVNDGEYDYANNISTTDGKESITIKSGEATSGLSIGVDMVFEGDNANKHLDPVNTSDPKYVDPDEGGGKITIAQTAGKDANLGEERVNAIMFDLSDKDTAHSNAPYSEGTIKVFDTKGAGGTIPDGGGLVFRTVAGPGGTLLYIGADIVDANGDKVSDLMAIPTGGVSFNEFMGQINMRYVPDSDSYSDVDVKIDIVASITDPESGDTKIIGNTDAGSSEFAKQIADGNYTDPKMSAPVAPREDTANDPDVTVAVDAVADKPEVDVTSKGEGQVDYAHKGGVPEGDEYTAARPGDTVTLHGKVTFNDYQDGSEQHSILVQAGNDNGTVTSITVGGNTYNVSDPNNLPKGVTVETDESNGVKYFKIDVADNVKDFDVDVVVKVNDTVSGDTTGSINIGGWAKETATESGGDQHTGKEGFNINNESTSLAPVEYNVAPVNGQLLFVAGKAYEGNDPNQHAGQGERTVADNSKGLQISISGNDSGNDEYIAKIYLQYAEGEGRLKVGDVFIPSGTYITRAADGTYTCLGKDAHGGDVTVSLTADQLANATGNEDGAIKYVPNADSDSDVNVPINIAATIVDPDSGDTVVSTNITGWSNDSAVGKELIGDKGVAHDDNQIGGPVGLYTGSNSTVAVDAVADKPTTTFVDSDNNKKIDAEYVGGDKAAQPGETVILKNISVEFGDYDPADGSEAHFLMVQRKDVDSTDDGKWSPNKLADQNMVLKGMDAQAQEHTLTLQIVGGKITAILLDGEDVSGDYAKYLVDVASPSSVHRVNAVEGSNNNLGKDDNDDPTYIYSDSYNNSPTNDWNSNSGDYFKIPVPNEFLNMVDGKVTADIAIDLPDTYKGDASFDLKVGGMALESNLSDNGEFENLNNAAYDIKNAEVKVGFASKPTVELTQDRIYENLTPNAHLTREQLDAAHKMGVDVNAPNGVDAADAKSGPAVMKVTGLDSTDSASITLTFSAKTGGNAPVDFTSEDNNDKFRVEVDLDGDGNISATEVFYVQPDGTVTIPGLKEGAELKIYPGHNNNSSDIKVDYAITVTDGNSGHSRTWTTEAKPADPDPNTSYGESAKEIDVDAVAQRPGVGTIDANVGKPNTSTPDPDDHYSHAAPGDYASLRTQVTFSDYKDGSEEHYVLVQYEAGCVPHTVVINGDKSVVIADMVPAPGTQSYKDPVSGETLLFYKIPVDNSDIAESTPPGTLDVEVKVKVDSSMDGKELRIGGMAHEPALPGQADTEWEVNNNTAIVVSESVEIKVSGTEGLKVDAGWVFDHDRPNEHMNEHNGVMEGKEIVEGLAPDGVMNGTVITIASAGNDVIDSMTFTEIPGGTLYYMPKGYSGDPQQYVVTDEAFAPRAGYELRFIPNRGSDNQTDYNDEDPVLKYKVEVHDPASGATDTITSSVTIHADAVAQAPTKVDGTDPADQDVTHGATVQIAVKALFEDLDGSEQHYILVEAHPNTSIAEGANYTILDHDKTYTHTHPDGTSVTYHKVLVDNDYLKANGGNADITVNYKTSGLDTPGDHEVRVGALSKEPDAGSDGTEYTIHNNEAFTDGGSVAIDFDHGTGGLWVGPTFENNTPNANVGDYTAEYGQIHVGTVPDGATSITIKLPDGVTLVDKDGAAYTPGNDGSYTVGKDDFDDIYIKMPENFSDQDFTLDYGFNVPGGTDYVWQVDDSASSMILYFDGNKDESITFSGLEDSKNGGKWEPIGNGEWVFQITKTGGQSWSDILDDFSATRGGQPVTDGDYYFLAGVGTPSSPKEGDLKEITQEPTVIGGSATVVVDAVAQQPKGLDESALVDGVLGEQNSVTIAVQATFQDSVEDVSETRHYVLVEKQPGFDIEGANTIFIEGKAYFQVDVTGQTPGVNGYEIELKLTDRSMGEGKVSLDTGALSVEIGADDDPGVLVGGADNDGDLEWRTNNNMGWKLNEKPCEVEISLVTAKVSVGIDAFYEHTGAGKEAHEPINIAVTGGGTNADVLVELTLKVDSGDLYYNNVKITNGMEVNGMKFAVADDGTVTVTSQTAGGAISTNGFSYDPADFSSADANLTWTAKLQDSASKDIKGFDGQPDVIIDAVAQAPDLSDIWAGGVEGQDAVQAGGDGKVSATLTFKDFAGDEEHWAILAHDNEWTCDTVTIKGVTYNVETFHNEDGQAFYGVKITNDMVDPATGKVTVDFNITAPDNVDSDTPYTLRVGGVSFEADDGTAAGDKEIKLGNNWAEKVTPVTVTIGVAETDEAQLKDGLVINETGPAIVLSLTGAGGANLETILDNNGEIITNTQFTFTQDRAAGDNSVSVGQVIGKITYGDQDYDVVVTSITGGKTVAGVNIPTAGGFDFDEDFLLQLADNYHNSNDITVNTVTTVKDASGDERTFPAAGDPANSSVIDVKAVANEGAIASIGNIALGNDPSFTVGVDNIVPGHAAEVSLGINGSFPDMDGSEQHYYFVQIPDGVEISSATSGAVNPADYPGCGLIAGNGAVYKLTEAQAAALKVKVTEGDFDQNDEVAVKVVAVSQEQSDYAAGGQYAYSDPGEAVIERGTVDFNLAPVAKGDGTVAGQFNSLRTDVVEGDLLDPNKVYDPDNDTGLKIASVNGVDHDGTWPWVITTGQGNLLTFYEDGTYKYERTNLTYKKGVETFTYTVKDPSGAESATLQLKVTVVDTNSPPQGVIRTVDGSIKPEYVGQIGFTDAEGDAVTLTSITVNNTTTAITEGSWSNNVLTVTGVYGALQITRGIGANGKPVYGYKYTTNADAVPGNTDVFTYKGVDSHDAPTSQDGKLTIKMETLVHSVEAGQTADGDGLPGWDAGAVINGAGGNLIHAGDGNDTITGGGPGQNTIYAGEGNDVIQAGNNAGDRIYAGHLDGQTGEYVADSGNNKITGGSGEDTIYGGLGNDTIDGGLGNDLIYGTAGNNSLSGGAGNDTIYGGTGNDDINGGDGNDVIYAGGAAGTTTTIHGDGGDDQIFAGLGTDILYGGSGEDTFIWLKDNFGGSDTIKDFGSEKDMISFADLFGDAQGNDLFVEDGVRTFLYDNGNGTSIQAVFFNNTTLQLEVTTDSGKQTITVESAQDSCFYNNGTNVTQDVANDILQHIIKEYSGT